MPRTEFQEDVLDFVAGPLGHIEGIALSSIESGSTPALHYFGGLPYALPPVGQYRFRRPRPLPEGYRYGTKASPGRFTRAAAYCPQPRRLQALDTSLWDENCLQLNIYIPARRPPPAQGWPVFFVSVDRKTLTRKNIHGGFLQWGTANELPRAIAPLLSETSFEAIMVDPCYRLNMFGFLASEDLQAEAWQFGESAGNMGFWDQRAALEWTAKNIEHFGGNPRSLTVGGYSAGGHSAFHQLAHELYFVPDDKAIIKRTICWSNSPGVQPKTVVQHQKQYDELLNLLNISLTLPASEKLRKLRDVPMEHLVTIQDHMKISEYRATSDDSFVSRDLIEHINSGDFGRRMKARGIKLMTGECMEEHNLYRTWRTPADSYDAVRTRLVGDYPDEIVEKLMRHYSGTDRTLPADRKDWQDLFGRIYADMQVHHLERGLYRALEHGGLIFGTDVYRYRINWRSKCVDNYFPPEWGVTHATDMAIWFWGLNYGDGLTEDDKAVLRPWNDAFAAFVKGEDVAWGTHGAKEVKRLRSDGHTDIWIDDQWEAGLEVWDLVNGSEALGIVGWVRSKL